MKRIVNTEWEGIYPCYYRQFPGIRKPQGLWYSINTEWVDWLSEVNWHERIYPNNLEIEVDLSRVLVLETLEQIISLKEEYTIFSLEKLRECIDWKSIADKYAGIEIRNYNELKWQGYATADFIISGFMWFYGWDVSSGCVWDLSIVKQLSI